jgi:ADP-dependent NAD(P)H-hydrate dehydratase
MTKVAKEILPHLPPRRPEAHKGDFGTALIVGGSRGMSGAPALAGMAALRGGAGLVRVAVPEVCLETVAGFEPCYTTILLPCDGMGRLSAATVPIVKEHAQAATALALGPGLGRSGELDRLAAALYLEIEKPMVVDADALNALSTQPDVLERPGGPRILTPHPGEFARLIGKKLNGGERNDAARDLAGRCGVVVLLKGHRTLITDGRRDAINTTGNPGMATGGTGDVLTGLIVALLCQELEPFDAARLAAYLHGLAGDLAAEPFGQISLTAKDLVEYLPQAFVKHGGSSR